MNDTRSKAYLDLMLGNAETLRKAMFGDILGPKRESHRRERKAHSIQGRVLRTKDAAAYIGLSEWKLRQMVHSGEIEVIAGKYWGFDRQSLDRWIESNREKKL